MHFQNASAIPQLRKHISKVVREEAWPLRESLFVTSKNHQTARIPMELDLPRLVKMKIKV